MGVQCTYRSTKCMKRFTHPNLLFQMTGWHIRFFFTPLKQNASWPPFLLFFDYLVSQSVSYSFSDTASSIFSLSFSLSFSLLSSSFSYLSISSFLSVAAFLSFFCVYPPYYCRTLLMNHPSKECPELGCKQRTCGNKSLFFSLLLTSCLYVCLFDC